MTESSDRSFLKIVLVGAGGWIGRAALSEIVRAGHTVIAASRRPPGGLGSETTWFRLDQQTDLAALTEVMRGAQSVVNTAGAAHLPSGKATDDSTFANEHLPRLIGEAAALTHVERVIHLSSIKSIGEGGPAPIRATQNAVPTTAYGRSKRAGEVAIQRAVAGTGVKLTIVRPPMVYGPGAPANFARLARLARSRKPVPLPVPYPRRSLVYIENLASLLVHLATSSRAGPVVHVSDVPHLTTRELVRELARAAGSRDWVVPLPSRFVTLAAQSLGRGADAERLSRSLIVEPSTVHELDGWVAPFPSHAGFRATMSGE